MAVGLPGTCAWNKEANTVEATTTNLVVLILASVGALFLLISALGIVRLPDVFTRMHAAGKAATLGVSCLLLSAGIYFQDTALLLRMIALIVLFFITAPIATTTMARAAYRTGDHEQFHLIHDDLEDGGMA